MSDTKDSHTDFAARPLGMRLAMLVRMWRAAINEAVAFTGLTQASWTTLMQLSLQGEQTTVSELAYALGIELPPLTRTLATLEERGFINRVADTADRRVKLISLTDAGREVLEAVSQEIEKCQQRVTNNIPEPVMDEFSNTTNILAANMMKLL
ncbi:MarR family transcriptional regulator [Salmonella enterica subsp. enterica serovar Choleraesuis]|nr:MarR family transcriptional regulator [Salmonella enterica subsp. enterica serovar Choleraesuis]